jgi:hypothetical protein
MVQTERRKRISKPKVFNEKRESMLLIKSATPADIYMWCLSIMFISIIIVSFLLFALFEHYQGA